MSDEDRRAFKLAAAERVATAITRDEAPANSDLATLVNAVRAACLAQNVGAGELRYRWRHARQRLYRGHPLEALGAAVSAWHFRQFLKQRR